MSTQVPAWFVPPAGIDGTPSADCAFDIDVDVEEPASARPSKAHWLLAAALPLAAGAVAAVLLSAVPEAAARPAPAAAPIVADAEAPQLAPRAEVGPDEELLPAIEVTAPEPEGKAAPSSPRSRRFAADGPLRAARIKLAAPATGHDRPTAALNARGAKLAGRHDWRGAFSVYLRATRLSPSDPEGWFGLALCHHELSHPRAASEATRHALLADPRHALSNILAGFLAQESGRFDEARAHYSRYLAAEPSGPHAGELKSVLDHLPAT